MRTTARFASANRQSADDIRAALVKEAENEDIPLQPEDIHVKGEAGHVQISADYSVTVDLSRLSVDAQFPSRAQEQSSPVVGVCARRN